MSEGISVVILPLEGRSSLFIGLNGRGPLELRGRVRLKVRPTLNKGVPVMGYTRTIQGLRIVFEGLTRTYVRETADSEILCSVPSDIQLMHPGKAGGIHSARPALPHEPVHFRPGEYEYDFALLLPENLLPSCFLDSDIRNGAPLQEDDTTSSASRNPAAEQLARAAGMDPIVMDRRPIEASSFAGETYYRLIVKFRENSLVGDEFTTEEREEPFLMAPMTMWNQETLLSLVHPTPHRWLNQNVYPPLPIEYDIEVDRTFLGPEDSFNVTFTVVPRLDNVMIQDICVALVERFTVAAAASKAQGASSKKLRVKGMKRVVEWTLKEEQPFDFCIRQTHQITVPPAPMVNPSGIWGQNRLVEIEHYLSIKITLRNPGTVIEVPNQRVFVASVNRAASLVVIGNAAQSEPSLSAGAMSPGGDLARQQLQMRQMQQQLQFAQMKVPASSMQQQQQQQQYLQMQRAASMPVQSWLTQQQSPQPFSPIGYVNQQQNVQQFSAPYGGSVQPPSMMQYGSSPITYGSMRNPASPPQAYTTPPGMSPSTFSPIAAANSRPDVPVRYDTISARGGGPSVPPRTPTMNMTPDSPPRVSRSGKSDRVLKWLKAVDTNEIASTRSGLPASPSSPPQYGYLGAAAATDVYSDVDSIMSPHTVVTQQLSSVGSNLRKTPTEVSYATAVPSYRSPTEVSYASMHSAVPSYKSGSTATPTGTPVRNNDGGFQRKASLPQLKFDTDGATPPQLIPGIVSPSVSTFWQGPSSFQGTNSDGSPNMSNAALNSSVDTTGLSAADEEEKRRTVLSLMSSNTGSMLLDVSVLMQGIKMMQGGAGGGGANGTHRPSPLGQEVGKDTKKGGDKKDEESSKLMVERLLTMLPQVEESSPKSARQRSMTLPLKLQSPAISLPPPPTSQPPPHSAYAGQIGSLPRSPKERTGPGFPSGPYSVSQPNLSTPSTNQQPAQSAQSVVIMGLPQPLVFTAVPQSSTTTQIENPPRVGYTYHGNESAGTLKSTESLVRQPSVSSGSAIGTPSLHAASTPQLAAAGIDVGSHLPAHLIPARNSSGPKRWQHTKKPSLPSLATQSAPSTPLKTTAGMELPLRKESLSQPEVPPVPPPKEFSGFGLLARPDGEVEMGVLYGNKGNNNTTNQPTTAVRTTTADSPPPPTMSPVVVVPDRLLPMGRKRSEGALGSPIVPPKSAARSSVLYANVMQHQRGSIGGTFHFEVDEVENKGSAGPASPEAEPLFSRRTSKASESADGAEDRFGMSPGADGTLTSRAGNRNSESESSNFFAAIAAAVLAEQGVADEDEEIGGGEDDGVFPRWKVRLTFSGGEGEEVAGETVQAVMSEYDLAVDPRNSIYTLTTMPRHKGERGSLRRRSSAPDFHLEEFEEERNGEGDKSKESLGQQAAMLKRVSSMGRRGSGTSAYWARRINALAKEYGDGHGGVRRPSNGSATFRQLHGGSDALGGSNLLGVSVAESDVSSAGTPNMGLTDDILNMYDGEEEGELARSAHLRTEAMLYGKTAAVKEDAVAVFQRALGIGRGGSGVGNWMASRNGPATASKSKLVSNRVS